MAKEDIIQHQFKKGQSGNPHGRPKGIPNAKTRYKRLLELTEKKTNPVTGEMEEFTVLEQMDMKIFAKALKGDLQAYKEIIDRLEGKASGAVDITTGGEALNIIIDNSYGKEPKFRTDNNTATTDGMAENSSQ